MESKKIIEKLCNPAGEGRGDREEVYLIPTHVPRFSRPSSTVALFPGHSNLQF